MRKKYGFLILLLLFSTWLLLPCKSYAATNNEEARRAFKQYMLDHNFIGRYYTIKNISESGDPILIVTTSSKFSGVEVTSDSYTPDVGYNINMYCYSSDNKVASIENSKKNTELIQRISNGPWKIYDGKLTAYTLNTAHDDGILREITVNGSTYTDTVDTMATVDPDELLPIPDDYDSKATPLTLSRVTSTIMDASIWSTTIVTFGDINEDGAVTLTDVVQVMRHIETQKSSDTLAKHPDWVLSEKQKIAADVDRDGDIDEDDQYIIWSHFSAVSSDSKTMKRILTIYCESDGEIKCCKPIIYTTGDSEVLYGEMPETSLLASDNRVFLGIYPTVNGGGEITANTQITNFENHTIYAKWKMNNAWTGEETIDLVNHDGVVQSKTSNAYKVLQQLAFAKFAYSQEANIDRHIGDTISTVAHTEWYSNNRAEDSGTKYTDKIWKNSNITVKQFYDSFVGDWKIIDYQNDNSNTGFVAYTLKKGNEVVIAYCGTETLVSGMDSNGNLTLGVDWDTDLSFAIMNELTGQFDLADDYYKKVVKENPGASITLTGHSLGGALAAYVSILHQAKAYTFDGADGWIMDLAYMYKSLDVDGFTGIENNNFVNYTDRLGYYGADLIQHTNVARYKNVDFVTGSNEAYENNGDIAKKDSNLPIKFYSHVIWTCLEPSVDDTAIYFTDDTTTIPNQTWTKDIVDLNLTNNLWDILSKRIETECYKICNDTIITKNMRWRKGRVMLGTSVADRLEAPNSVVIDNAFKLNTSIFGGDGSDTLIGYSGDDVLVAGNNGTKKLDGMGGNDVYVIEAGNSNSTIYDCSGTNYIYLKGFDGNSFSDITVLSPYEIQMNSTQQKVSIVPMNFGETSMTVCMNNKRISWQELTKTSKDNTLSAAKALDSNSNDLQFLEVVGEGTIQILNNYGRVVQTISNKNKEQDAIYENYGCFYAFNDGETQKLMAYTAPGYSVKLEGSDSIDLASAVVSTDGVEGLERVKNIELDTGAVLQKTDENGLEVLQQDGEKYVPLSTVETIIPVKKITASDVTIQMGESKNISCSLSPSSATNKTCSYTVKNNKIAIVDKTGKITAKSIGETTIDIVSKDGYGAYTTIKITVTSTKASGIKISGISKQIAAGKQITLKANVSPSNATNKSVTWKSSNTKVATVSSKGVVTIKKKTGGKSVTITATAKDGSGVKGTYRIKSMKGVVKKITLSGKKTVKVGKSIKLKAKVSASKGANKKVVWSSSKPAYATVSSNGIAKAKKAGKGKTVKITVKATDGSNKSKSIKIKIK